MNYNNHSKNPKLQSYNNFQIKIENEETKDTSDNNYNKNNKMNHFNNEYSSDHLEPNEEIYQRERRKRSQTDNFYLKKKDQFNAKISNEIYINNDKISKENIEEVSEISNEEYFQ